MVVVLIVFVVDVVVVVMIMVWVHVVVPSVIVTVVVVVVVVIIRSRLFRRLPSSLALNFLRLSYLLTRALWARITKNTDWSTRPLARPFARSLAPLTRGKVCDWMAIYSVFFFYSGP